MNMTKISMLFSGIFLFLLFIVGRVGGESDNKKLIVTGELFRHKEIVKYRIIKQPNGPFAAMIFDEDALAIYVCIIYYDNMGDPINEKWSISERVWCNGKWGSDITSLYWCPNGKCLYIGTSLVYGDGGVFRLDLYNKTFTKIYPSKDLLPTGKQGKRYVSSAEIMEASKDILKLRVEFSEIVGNEERPLEEKTVTIPLKQ
jgi:hypothetical protein